jgi:hypothetical protein
VPRAVATYLAHAHRLLLIDEFIQHWPAVAKWSADNRSAIRERSKTVAQVTKELEPVARDLLKEYVRRCAANPRKAAEMGFRYFEPMVHFGRELMSEAGYFHTVSMFDDPWRIKDACHQAGLTISGLQSHGPLGRPDVHGEYLKLAIRVAAEIGVPVVNTDWAPVVNTDWGQSAPAGSTPTRSIPPSTFGRSCCILAK